MKNEDTVFERHIRPMTPISTGETPAGLSKMRRVKAILFDVYGTLVISEPSEMDFPAMSDERKRVLRDVLQRHGIDRTPESLMDALRQAIETVHEKLRRKGTDYPEIDIVRIWQTLLNNGDTDRVKAFALEFEMAINPVYPMPGLVELLSACRTQDLPIGIISNAQFYTPRLLEHLLGTSLDLCGFDPQLTFYSYRLGSAKPSCLMFDLAVDIFSRRGISPASVLYVGNDMRNDILPAKTVGFQTALFAGDRRSLRRRVDDIRCRHLVPEVIITDLRQLIVDTGNS